MKTRRASDSLYKSFSVIFTRLKRIALTIDANTNLAGYRSTDSVQETLTRIFTIIEELNTLGNVGLRVNKNKDSLDTVLKRIFYYTAHIGASLNLFNGILSATGTGAGVSTITMQSNASMIITVDGNANFYTDANGTLGASKTWTVEPGADRTIYLKLTSGASKFDFPASKLLKWVAWTSGANAASLTADISKLTNVTYINMVGWNVITGSVTNLSKLAFCKILGDGDLGGDITNLAFLTSLEVCGLIWNNRGHNQITGDITNKTGLTRLRIFGDNIVFGDITNLTNLIYIQMDAHGAISGDVTLLTKLTMLDIVHENTITGDVTNLVNMEYLWIDGTLSNITGSVTGMTNLYTFFVKGVNTISGDITGLTKMYYMDVQGSNTLTGSVSGMNLLIYLLCHGNNTITGNLALLPVLMNIDVRGSNTLYGDLSVIANNITGDLILEPCEMVTYTAGATWKSGWVNISPAVGYGYSTTEINNILIDMNASAGLANKTVILKGNNDIRSSASDAAVTALIGKGCTIQTNALGPELVVNGNFTAWTGDNPDGWSVTESAPNLVTQNGINCRMVTTSPYVGIAQAILEVGATYQVSINIISRTGDGIIISAGLTEIKYDSIPGLKTVDMLCTSNPNLVIKREWTLDCVFNNISVRKKIAV